MKARHEVCQAGAAVLLHGYMPAVVLKIERDEDGRLCADCRVTVRRRGLGPHGYTPGELVNVRAADAIPRDLVHVSRHRTGALVWNNFSIEMTA